MTDTKQTIDKDTLMRELDRESSTRIWTGTPKKIITAVTALFALYCIYSTLFSVQALEIRLTSFLGMVIIIGYLSYPLKKSHLRANYIPWYDAVLMTAGAAAMFFYCFRYPVLARTLTSASKMTPFLTAAGIVAIIVLAELCRRCVGLPILCVAAALIVYTFFNLKANGQSLWQVMERMLYTLFYSTGGILGTPVQVCAKYIAVFIIFGAFLERTGISGFFISCANAAAGASVGGPAKVAVISSALCGMVSGSSVGNTVTTGSVTIPMMKKTGYKPEFAGAVEAAASTGGQLMPPVMGAAAFLMAEYMGIGYGKVALYAVLPAVLYFTGIFISVHLEAEKQGLKGIPRQELPKLKDLLPKVYLLIPLIILVWLVAGGVRTLAYSASIAIIAAIAVSIPAMITDGGSVSTGMKGLPVRLKNLAADSLEAGGRGCVTAVIACCMAGIVAGCITATGLASRLISGVIAVSSALPDPSAALLAALFLTMICCLVLGMGVPTTANYCIMASTCAPILIQMGVDPVAAHFFVFYFGIAADITPPVALAAYAGSAIAGSDPVKTGINASKLAVAAFIVPYIFAMNPSMLLMNQGPAAAVMVIFTSLAGIFAIAAALSGFVKGPLNVAERIGLAIGGILLLIPGILTDIAGILITALILIRHIAFKGSGKNPA